MRIHCIAVTLLISSVTFTTCYSVGRSGNQLNEGRISWEGYSDFPDENRQYHEVSKSTAYENYFNSFFGNDVNRVVNRSPQRASAYHLKTKATSESPHKLHSDYYVPNIGQRADFGNYDLFRFQVEGNLYNPYVYYRHPLPKSRTNLPGFAQRVVFEDELPIKFGIPHRFRDF